MTDRRLPALLTVSLLVLLAGGASAHSFDRNFASARYALDLDAEALHVLVVQGIARRSAARPGGGRDADA